jgi:RNA polymerase sigma factor (sigma-70 family)
MSMDQWTDKQLIDHWQAAKDHAAFRILDDRHRPRITRFIRKSLYGYFKNSADDIAQDVLVELQTTAQVFFDAPAVSKWLVTVANCRVKNFLRDQHAAKRDANRTVEFSTLLAGCNRYHQEYATEEPHGRDDTVPLELLDEDTPDRLACANEARGIVRRLIDRLPGQERAVLTKFCLERHDLTSTAEALGISRSTAFKCLQRAREKLSKMYEIRQLLGESAEEPSPERESTRAAGQSLLENLPKIILILLAVIGSVADACADKQRHKSLLRLPLRPVAAVPCRPVLDREHPSVRVRPAERREASTLPPDFGPFGNDRKDGGGVLSFRTGQSARSPSKVPRGTTLEAA